MAIYDGIGGRRRGSVGNETYTYTKGQNIVKAKVIKPLNPRSEAQQTQRAKFSSAVPFYQLATKNFFKFAFDDKTSKENDFNAFMRNNAELGVIYPKPGSEWYKNLEGGEWPLIAPWKLSTGNLVAPVYTSEYTIASAYPDHNIVKVKLASTYYREDMVKATTIGEASAIMVEAGIAEEGDILTFVFGWQSEAISSPSAGTLAIAPKNLNNFAYKQIVVNTTDTRSLDELGFASVFVGKDGTAGTMFSASLRLYNHSEDLDSFAGCDALIKSRKSGGKLLVSNSTLRLNAAAAAFAESASSESYRKAFLETWNASADAILAGGK